jgi:hypothetical protein
MLGYTRWTEHGEPPAVRSTRTEEPLHSQTEVSRISTVKELMEFKSKFKISDESFDHLLDIICKTLPKGHKMPANVHECKKYLSDLETPSSKTEGESSKRKRRS